MRKPLAVAGSAAFFVVAPAMVGGLIPWWLTGFGTPDLSSPWAPVRVLGLVLLACGVAVLLHAFTRFAVEGLGTPAPVAPTEHLVVGGLYRHVRNPMYVAVLSCITGQAVALGSARVAVYGVVVAGAFVAFVRWHEEPVLARRFGEGYDAYRGAVPGWLPRLRPWTPPDPG